MVASFFVVGEWKREKICDGVEVGEFQVGPGATLLIG